MRSVRSAQISPVGIEKLASLQKQRSAHGDVSNPPSTAVVQLLWTCFFERLDADLCGGWLAGWLVGWSVGWLAGEQANRSPRHRLPVVCVCVFSSMNTGQQRRP